ncbi:MAG: hypothetical protein I3J02_09260 [Prevotella sp.]|nr:hypothetical protein [Prevotella sp.]
MVYNMKNGTLSVRVICVVLFLVFTFLYLFDYQADILAVTQHVLSKGQTHYDRTIGAFLITFMLWLVQIAVYASTKLNSYFHALTYMPSLLLLGILTDITPHLEHESYLGNWLWIFPLLMVCFAGLAWFGRQFESIHMQDKGPVLIKLLWVNLLTMVVLMLMTCGIGCSGKEFHYRMKMESALLAHHPEQAISLGITEQKTDSSLTFLRIWSLSKTHQLGEVLFEYPLVGGSDAMLPNGTSVKLMMVPEKNLYKDLGVVFTKKLRPKEYLEKLHENRWATPLSHDWLLCAYLLDGDLDHFVETLPRYYKITSSLPKHYKEALILYTHLKNQPKLVYHDEVMDADYEDYQDLRRKNRNPQLQYSVLHDSYGKTYWFYYHNLKR